MASATEPVAARALPAWRLKLSASWRWWSGEILQMVPERFAALRGAARVPLVVLAGTEVVLVEPRSAVGPEGRVEMAALDERQRRSALHALLERAGETRDRARLCLEHDEALVRRISMPAATEENLRQVLAFEMDRLTPFRAEDVYYDYRVVSRNGAGAQLGVQLAVARRDVVDARVATLRNLGVNVQGVAVRDDAGHAGAPLDLLPSEQRGERESARERLVQRVLLVAVLALVALVLGLPVWQKRETAIALNPQIDRARRDAEATDAISKALEKQVKDYNFLLAKKHSTYPVLAYLEEVTRILPDNTWVQQMDVKTVGKAREVQISGETQSSSRLIEILEQSQLLQNAAMRGSVTRGATPGTERFVIAAEARSRPLPDATPVLEMAPESGAAARGPATPAAPLAAAPKAAASTATLKAEPKPAPATPAPRPQAK